MCKWNIIGTLESNANRTLMQQGLLDGKEGGGDSNGNSASIDNGTGHRSLQRRGRGYLDFNWVIDRNWDRWFWPIQSPREYASWTLSISFLPPHLILLYYYIVVDGYKKVNNLLCTIWNILTNNWILSIWGICWPGQCYSAYHRCWSI